jgi:hypothetical protein
MAPFAADTDSATAVARLTTPAPSIVASRPDLPPELAHLVERALARDPNDRWASAAALRDALAGFRGDAPSFDPAITALVVEDPTGTVDATRPVRVAPRPAAQTRPERRAQAAQAKAATAGGSSLARVVIWVIAFAIGATGGYLGYRALDDDTPTDASATPTATAPAPLPVAAVQDYDPEGTGSRGENPEQVGAVIDGNAVTAWSTEDYQQRDVGGLKSGVGLVLDLGAPKQLDSVQVDARGTGWNAEVYAGDAIAPERDGWGAPVAAGTDLGRQASLGLTAPARARYVLLWITNLPPDGPPFRLEVAEVRVVGTA